VPWDKGNYDAYVYYRMITGETVDAPGAYRVLVPAIARRVLRGVGRLPLGTWDPVLLSLLAVNAAFASLSAVLLMRIAATMRQDVAVVALAPFVYLSSFVVVNFHLAGLVDAAEGFFLIALLLVMLCDRWAWAPLLVGVGVLAKETVLPLAVGGMAAWWIVARLRCDVASRRRAAWLAAAMVAGVVSLGTCRLLIDVPPYEAHVFSWSRLAALPAHLAECILDKTQIYAFMFLLPLGIPRLGKIAAPLLIASLGMAVVAGLLGAYADIHGNMHRPWFNTLGPMLTISSSILLRDLASRMTRDEADCKQ